MFLSNLIDVKDYFIYSMNEGIISPLMYSLLSSIPSGILPNFERFLTWYLTQRMDQE